MRLQRTSAMIMVVSASALLMFAGCGKDEADQTKGSPPADTVAALSWARQQPDTAPEGAGNLGRETARAHGPAGLPRLIDLGRGTCIPCKKMAPILDELKKEYRGRAVIDVIDLREDLGAAQKYGIRLIPTQIFLDDEGREVWRHEGFLGKDAIVAKLREMGVEATDN
jgi:thioredoxin 1